MTKPFAWTRSLLIAAIVALLGTVGGAQTLTTTFAGGSGFPGIMFDMSTQAGPILINDFDVNMDAGTWTVDVWVVTAGTTFEPHHTDITSWTLLGSSTVVTNGPNVATPLGLNLAYYMPPLAKTGFYLTTTNNTASTSPINYTLGSAGGAVYASDSFLAIYEGIGKGLSGYPTTFAPTIGGGTLPFPSTSSRIPNISVHYVPASSFADDVALTAITAPVDSVNCEFLTSTETVSATFTNYGSNTVMAGAIIQLDLVVDGGPATSEFILLPNNLPLGQSYTHTFAATANLAASGAHTIDVTVVYSGDLDNSNDSRSKIVNSGNPNTITSFPWLENFDSVTVNNGTTPPAGWTQDTTDATGTNSDWVFRTGTTLSANTGPNGDRTSGAGYYAYTEDAGNFAQINLDTPCLDLATLVSPVMNFWVHSFNANASPVTTQNLLSIDVISYPGGTVTIDVAGPIGHQAAANWASSSWTQFSANLAPFAGQLVQLRFRGQSSGGSTLHDIAIDDIGVFEPVPTPGQAPRPGLSVFDIEGAINSNLSTVGSGLGGPYFTTVTQGSSFNLHFEGEPNQPIVVVYGALNPVSATYPSGIGQFDIGGPGVDPNGIPLNIAVFANAIGWVQAGAPGFPFDAFFFTKATGDLDVGFNMPPFGIPAGTTLSTFQAAIDSASAPFIYIANAVQVTLN